MRIYVVIGVVIILVCMLLFIERSIESYYQGGKIIGYDGNPLTIASNADFGPDDSYGWYKDGYTNDRYGPHCNATKLPNCLLRDANNPNKCTKCILQDPTKEWDDKTQIFIPNYAYDPDTSKKGLGGCKLNILNLTKRYVPQPGYTCPAGLTYDVGPFVGRIKTRDYVSGGITYYFHRLYRAVRCTMKVGDIIDRINRGVNEAGIDYSKIEALPSGNRDDVLAGYWTNVDRIDTDPMTFEVSKYFQNLPFHNSQYVGQSGDGRGDGANSSIYVPGVGF